MPLAEGQVQTVSTNARDGHGGFAGGNLGDVLALVFVGVAREHDDRVGRGGQLTGFFEVFAGIKDDLAMLGRSRAKTRQGGRRMGGIDATRTVVAKILEISQVSHHQQTPQGTALEGQDAPVLKEHDTLLGGLPGQGNMGRASDDLGGVRLGIGCRQNSKQAPEHAANGVVEPLRGHGAGSDTLGKGLPKAERIGRLDVETRGQGIDSPAAENEIRINESVECPLVF